jgi:hypothetical protein
MRIADLPALTQARLITELEYDPDQVGYVKALLKTADPAAELVRQQEKVALDVIKPGTFPQVQHRWPVFRMYFTEAYKRTVAKTAREQKRKGISGLGSMGDWLETLVKEAMPLVKEYGVPILKKNIEIATKTGKYAKDGDGSAAAKAAAEAAAAAVDAGVKAAEKEQEEIAHEAAPKTNPEPKKEFPTALAVGGTVAALAVALAAAIALGGKKRR